MASNTRFRHNMGAPSILNLPNRANSLRIILGQSCKISYLFCYLICTELQLDRFLGGTYIFSILFEKYLLATYELHQQYKLPMKLFEILTNIDSIQLFSYQP